MKEFGIIHVRFWDWAMENKIPDQSKIIATYMLTCRHANSLGCFRLPQEYVSSDLGYPIDTLSIPYQYLIDTGFLCFCEVSKWVFLPKYLRWNPPQNSKHAKGIVKHIHQIPSSFKFKDKLLESCKIFLFPSLDQDIVDTVIDTLSIPYQHPINTLSIPYRYTDTDTNTNTNTNTKKEEAPFSDHDGMKISGQESEIHPVSQGKKDEESLKKGEGVEIPENSRESPASSDPPVADKQSQDKSKGKPKAKPGAKDINPDYLVLSRQYLEKHKELYPGLTKKVEKAKVESGAAAVGQLVRIEGYDLEEIRRTVMWAVRDDFWAKNLLSLASLRNKGKNEEIKFKNILASMKRLGGRADPQFKLKGKDYGKSEAGFLSGAR